MSTDPIRPPEVEAFPAQGRFVDQAKYLLGWATRAPSGHNTQPWLFAVGDGWIDVVADRRRALPVVDPEDRELAISCGAAIATLEAAARAFGCDVAVEPGPQAEHGDTLARVAIGRAEHDKDHGVLRAIAERRTTRVAYGPEVPGEPLVERCQEIAGRHGVAFDVFESEAKRGAIAQLVAQGDEVQFDDPSFRRELASWVHSTRLGSRDGMSGSGFGMPDILAPVARFVMRSFDLGNGIAAADSDKILSGTAMLGLLSSAGDSEAEWVATGRALAEILLALTAEGFTASYLNQPIEVAELRPRLREAAGVEGLPQILLRIGKADAVPPATVRRDVGEVIA